jgi:hypothetical protein
MQRTVARQTPISQVFSASKDQKLPEAIVERLDVSKRATQL